MKKTALLLLPTMLLLGCGTSSDTGNKVTVESHAPSGFDVNKLAEIVKKSTNPKDLEKAINDPKNRISNLDLDNDGSVDYLSLAESTDGQLTIYDNAEGQDPLSIATITIGPEEDGENRLAIDGEQTYCGDVYTYGSYIPQHDFLFVPYYAHAHHGYVSTFYYGHYPRYYTRTRVVSYRPTYSRVSSSSVNSGKTGISTATRSQRAFSARSASNKVTGSGFGKKSASSSYSLRSFLARNPSSTGTSSSSGSSRSSFGSGKSSFGRSTGSSYSSSSPSKTYSSSSKSSFGSSRSSFGRSSYSPSSSSYSSRSSYSSSPSYSSRSSFGSSRSSFGRSSYSSGSSSSGSRSSSSSSRSFFGRRR